MRDVFAGGFFGGPSFYWLCPIYWLSSYVRRCRSFSVHCVAQCWRSGTGRNVLQRADTCETKDPQFHALKTISHPSFRTGTGPSSMGSCSDRPLSPLHHNNRDPSILPLQDHNHTCTYIHSRGWQGSDAVPPTVVWVSGDPRSTRDPQIWRPIRHSESIMSVSCSVNRQREYLTPSFSQAQPADDRNPPWQPGLSDAPHLPLRPRWHSPQDNQPLKPFPFSVVDW